MFTDKKPLILATALIALAVLVSGCLPSTPPPPCTTDFLVWSINNANGNGPGTDTINLDPGCTYMLGVVDNTIDGNNGLPSITSSIVINGNGATVRRSTGAQKAAIRLFHISQGGELILNDITLYDGLGMNPPDVTIQTLNSGGAIYNNGILTVNNSTLDYNRAMLKGGAIYNTGNLTVNNSTLKNNSVNIDNAPGESGGAIYNEGIAVINASTVSGNMASQSGGGIANAYGGNLSIVSSTISGNSTTLSGIASGAAVMNGGDLSISFSTITSNAGTTSGAVFSAPDTIAIYNSIIATNLPQNCSYPATSAITGANLDNDGSCDNFTINDDPQLGPLANNGGPTLTHAFAPSSPAKNSAVGFFPPTDQRGEPRPHGSGADLGSFELTGSGGIQQTPAVLSGIVFNDQNGDGVMDPGEPPFAGVELVYGDGTCATAGLSQTALSASDGSYQFILLSPNAGTHCISIDPLVEPNTSILIPGGFTAPTSGQHEVTITEGQTLAGLDFGWMWQFGPNPTAANMEITNVNLSATTIPINDWVGVEVTVTNQGSAAASGYDLVLIPHYGWGPPNPGGYQSIPDLLPGASHTVVFSPGVLYSNLGTFTLRVLLTDDWYALGDPDSTGTNGDYQDFTITVTEAMSFCNPFENMDISVFMLKVDPKTLVLPLYLKFPDGVPGQDQEDPWMYRALLGDMEAYQCGLQGFEDRLYCMFQLQPNTPGLAFELKLFVDDCEDPAYIQPLVTVPIPKIQCAENLAKDACEAAGGKMSTGVTTAPSCICP